MITLSIIIPVWNGAGHRLERCLDSIAAEQLPRGGYEVICVDDCSDDGVTLPMLRERTDVRLVEAPYKMRQGGARNLGVEVARGEFFTFIDQDDYYLPGALKQVFDALQAETADLIVTDNVELGVNGSSSAFTKLRFAETDVLSPEEFIEKNGVVYAPWRMVVRRGPYRASGVKFREKTRLEDIDWGLRLLHSVKSMRFMPVAMVCWEHNGGSTVASITRDRVVLTDYLEACTLAMSHAREYFPGNIKVERFVARSIDYGVQYLFLLPVSAQDKEQMIRQLPHSQCYRPLISRIIGHPLAAARLINAGRPLWLLARKLYRLKAK